MMMEPTKFGTTIIIVIITTIFITLLWIRDDKQKEDIKELYKRVSSVSSSIDTTKFIVTVTTYNPTVEQCDATPDKTACNFKIDLNDPYKQKIVGLSRDLLKYFCYGETILIKNCGKFDGYYTVVDCANKRLKKTVDICIGRNMIGGRFENAILIKQ